MTTCSTIRECLFHWVLNQGCCVMGSNASIFSAPHVGEESHASHPAEARCCSGPCRSFIVLRHCWSDLFCSIINPVIRMSPSSPLLGSLTLAVRSGTRSPIFCTDSPLFRLRTAHASLVFRQFGLVEPAKTDICQSPVAVH